jgi:LemA protein
MALLAAGVVWVVITYNLLVRARNRVDEAWSGIDVQLKRRHDLVPNLVETVKGYASHEGATLAAATRARAAAISATSLESRASTEAVLSDAVAHVRIVAEQYPALLASENFKQLQLQLAEVESEIRASRQIYNSNVRFLNDRTQAFPSSIVASMTAITARRFFDLDQSGEALPAQVSFA